MVVDQVDVKHVTAFKAKNDPPIRANGHGPIAFQIPRQRVQPKCRQIHDSNRVCAIKRQQYQSNLFDLIDAQASPVVPFEQASQRFVPEALDHCRDVYSVTLLLSVELLA